MRDVMRQELANLIVAGHDVATGGFVYGTGNHLLATVTPHPAFDLGDLEGAGSVGESEGRQAPGARSAFLVLRRDDREAFFRSPGPTPALAAVLCVFLIAVPWGERDPIVYRIALGLLGIGVVLWALTWLTNRGVRAKKTGFRDVEHL